VQSAYGKTSADPPKLNMQSRLAKAGRQSDVSLSAHFLRSSIV
jgi:hypothetical protein